ncbi:hypothetical protein ED733_003535 [Metarhizium rileyi]|uniref:Uncharacterized protein n=1 Tax=Metarhizium rileyi (strain RCEF 4871) TaxID=1649241 RepID=A0A5C6GDA7_METRR|nr:hypothetical protein ED733_003535 [Metarhizium rileyi]
MPPRRLGPLGEVLLNIWRLVFTLIVIAVFVVAWLVQSEVIKTPKWARDWSGETPEVQRQYATALMTPVCLVFLFFAVAGFAQLRRDNVA